jgi:hypothetical protein
LGKEKGEDCDTSIFSPAAYIVASLVGWSLKAEMVESTLTPQSASNCLEMRV